MCIVLCFFGPDECYEKVVVHVLKCIVFFAAVRLGDCHSECFLGRTCSMVEVCCVRTVGVYQLFTQQNIFVFFAPYFCIVEPFAFMAFEFCTCILCLSDLMLISVLLLLG